MVQDLTFLDCRFAIAMSMAPPNFSLSPYLSVSLCIYCHQIYHRKFSGETFELQRVEVSITEKKRKGKNRRAKMRKVKQGNGKTVR